MLHAVRWQVKLNALPMPAIDASANAEAESTPSEPQSPLSRRIAALFATVLGLPARDIRANQVVAQMLFANKPVADIYVFTLATSNRCLHHCTVITGC